MDGIVYHMSYPSHFPGWILRFHFSAATRWSVARWAARRPWPGPWTTSTPRYSCVDYIFEIVPRIVDITLCQIIIDYPLVKVDLTYNFKVLHF